MTEEVEATEDYKIQAEGLKDAGNDAFKAGDMAQAIDFYTQAITIDPDNHVLYSNRSAAYLKSDSKSKALWDAQKCVELQPEWAKGYSRLGAALHSLGRFEAAIDTYKQGLGIEPDNKAMQDSMQAAREGYEAERVIRHAQAAKEREARARELEAKHAAKQAAKQAKKQDDMLSDFLTSLGGSNDGQPDAATSTTAAESKASSSAATASDDAKPPAAENADDLLASFLDEVSTKQVIKEPVRDQKEITAKYQEQELGTPQEIIDRLLQHNHEWKNLNPYYVLDLDIDATDEDIKQRYRKLSTRVHPDKLLGVENAREAFEEVKKAYQLLQDEDKKQLYVSVIDELTKEVQRSRKKLIAKGARESELPEVDTEIKREIMKYFATMEVSRLKSQQNQRSYAARERKQEDEAKAQQEKEKEFEQNWTQEGRRDKRVGHWRDFAKDPSSKRVKATNYKEETRNQGKPKYGTANLESWKKSWK